MSIGRPGLTQNCNLKRFLIRTSQFLTKLVPKNSTRLGLFLQERFKIVIFRREVLNYFCMFILNNFFTIS